MQKAAYSSVSEYQFFPFLFFRFFEVLEVLSPTLVAGAAGGATGATDGGTAGAKAGKTIGCGCMGTRNIPGGTAAEAGAMAIIVGAAAIGADDTTVTVVAAAVVGVEADVPLPTSSVDGFEDLSPFLPAETGLSPGLFSLRDSSNLRTFSLASFITQRTYSIASGSVAPISTMSAKYWCPCL